MRVGREGTHSRGQATTPDAKGGGPRCLAATSPAWQGEVPVPRLAAKVSEPHPPPTIGEGT